LNQWSLEIHANQSSNYPWFLLSVLTFLYSSFKTYNQDHQVPDSAGTATQFLCGVKTNTGVLGVDASVVREKCETMNEGSKVTSIVDWSIAKSKYFN
jgi:alkaline phosphatase